MRLRDVAGEARRNLRAGTSNALLFALSVAVLGALVGGADVATSVEGIRTVEEFRASGASVQMINSNGYIDGAGCDSLSGSDGTTASGAYRLTDTGVRPLALPSTQLTRVDATPGVIDVLTGAEKGRPAASGPGLWISATLATDLGLSVGDVFQSDLGDTTIAGIYPYPNDGRDRALAYALLAVLPSSDGPFDTCLLNTWPPRQRGDGWTAPAVIESDQSPTFAQLNTKLGADLDLPGLGAKRSTRYAPAVGAVAGLVLGVLAIRRRRVELASALHSGVPRSALTVQVLIETAVWATAGAIIAVPVLTWLAVTDNPASMVEPWVAGLRVLATTTSACVLGAFGAMLVTRESHLFRYFKER